MKHTKIAILEHMYNTYKKTIHMTQKYTPKIQIILMLFQVRYTKSIWLYFGYVYVSVCVFLWVHMGVQVSTYKVHV